MEGYFNKCLLTGFDTRGNLIEVMYNLLDEETAWVFHAVPPRIPDIAKPVLGGTYADDDRNVPYAGKQLHLAFGAAYFKIYKDTIEKGISNSIPLYTDLGYQGIEQYHTNCFIPIKSSKKHKLTKKEKAYNRQVARRRVAVEYINNRIKTFKCMAYPYRGHYQNPAFALL